MVWRAVCLRPVRAACRVAGFLRTMGVVVHEVVCCAFGTLDAATYDAASLYAFAL